MGRITKKEMEKVIKTELKLNEQYEKAMENTKIDCDVPLVCFHPHLLLIEPCIFYELSIVLY